MAKELKQKDRNTMTARVVSLDKGMTEYRNVSVIHIKSRYYNLPVSYTHLTLPTRTVV